MRFINRLLLLGGVGVAVAAGGCEPEPERPVRPPRPRPQRQPLTQSVEIDNVILISIDTLRADHLACYGHEFVRSPNIDALAREALLFTQHISAAPTTLASHTSLMTGTYPHTHGVAKNGYVVNDDNVMLAEVLERVGFKTAGFIGAYPLDPEFRFHQGFDHYDADCNLAEAEGVRDQAQRRADRVTDAVLDWLDSQRPSEDEPQGGKRRLFLFVHYFDPHWPYGAPAPYNRMYQKGPILVDGSTKAIERTRMMFASGQIDQALERIRVLDAEYCAEITYCDHQLGRLMNGLRARHLFDDSLIVVTSDHGETMHEHGNLLNHGLSVYDTEVLIPLIMRFPGGRFGGRREEVLCSNIDVMPTILHLLDLPENDRLEGRSFAGLIDGPLPEREPVFIEATQPYWEPAFHKDATWVNRDKFQGVRTATHKYMFRLPDQRFEFYDLRNDPLEQVNLLEGDRDYDTALAERMRGQLERWRDQAQPLASYDIETVDVTEKLRALGYVYDAQGADDKER